MTLRPEEGEGPSYNHHPLYTILAGVLMMLGLVLSFFYIHWGGALVGLAIGISFFGELQRYFFHAREYATVEGLFKTLMLVGLLLFLLLAATAFVITTVVGFVIMTLLNLHTLRR